MPRVSTSARGSPPSCQTISNRSFGDLAGDRALADQIDDCPKLCGRNRRRRNVTALLVEPPEQFVDHPVGGKLAVTGLVGEPCQHGFVEIRALAFGHQHAGVVGRKPKADDEAGLLLSGNSGRSAFSSSTYACVNSSGRKPGGLSWRSDAPLIHCLHRRSRPDRTRLINGGRHDNGDLARVDGADR